MDGKKSRVSRRSQKTGGFTLLELMAIVAILGVLSALILPRLSSVVVEARISKTKEKIAILKQAISGDSSALSGGRPSITGYEIDVGGLPDSLTDLVTKPASVKAYDLYTKRGWNGPYIKEAKPGDYLTDGWNNNFIYTKAGRTITSYGADGAAGGTGDNADITINL